MCCARLEAEPEKGESYFQRRILFIFITPEHKIVKTEMKKLRFINVEVISPTGATAQSAAL